MYLYMHIHSANFYFGCDYSRLIGLTALKKTLLFFYKKPVSLYKKQTNVRN